MLRTSSYPFDKARIVGVGETAVGKLPGRTTIQLQAEAISNALKDAGIPLNDVDGLVAFSGFTRTSLHHCLDLSGYLGIDTAFPLQVDAGGLLTPMLGLFNAAAAIASGQCRVAVCAFGENALSARKPDTHGWRVQPTAYPFRHEFEAPFGAEAQLISFALLSQRYLYDYGGNTRDFGAVAVSMRKHASLHPGACKREPITLEDHQASRMISTPLRLLDFSLISDGAGAIVLTTSDRAKELRTVPVQIIGIGINTYHQNINLIPEVNFHQEMLREATGKALENTGLTQYDIDLIQVYDGWTGAVLLFLEGIGLCKEGRGGEYAAEGRLELGNRPAFNPHGGLLSHAHNGGIFHFTEAVKQLRGECGNRQVKDAEIALIGGMAGLANSQGYGIMLLERE
jgi:acetyl-CoA acetyltransferase